MALEEPKDRLTSRTILSDRIMPSRKKPDAKTSLRKSASLTILTAKVRNNSRKIREKMVQSNTTTFRHQAVQMTSGEGHQVLLAMHNAVVLPMLML